MSPVSRTWFRKKVVAASQPLLLLCRLLTIFTTLLDAGPTPDGSVALSQELLAKLETLPEDAQPVGHLLKQGHLPVPHRNLDALEDMTKDLVVGSSGKLAEFFGNKIWNGGLLDATGKIYSLLLKRPMQWSQVNHALLMFPSV